SSGARAEEACAQFLRARGLVVLARNWRCRHGEIDIVAEDRGVVVFAEVRMRSGARFGGAAESITPAKRARPVAAARVPPGRRPQASRRLDVLPGGTGPWVHEWIRDAFSE